MKPRAAVGSPEVGLAIVRLRSGDVFVALPIADLEQRAAGLESVLQTEAEDGTRVVWVGNPLRSALTMVRLLLQIVGPEIDFRIERSPAELAVLITQAQAAERRVLVIVQQPETIDPETIETLGAMAAHLAHQPVRLQFLFAGSPALRLPGVSSADAGPMIAPATRFEAGDWTVGAIPQRRRALTLALLLLAVILGAVASLAVPVQSLKILTAAAATASLPKVNLGPTGLNEFLSRQPSE